MQLSIIIPVYNEISTIEELLGKVQQVDIGDIKKEIIIVDDYSTDGSRELLKSILDIHENMQSQTNGTYLKPLDTDNIKVFFQSKNSGKGAALRTGISQATGDIIIIQDADLEYNPEEYRFLITPIVENKADVVYGSRFLNGTMLGDTYFWHNIANRFLTFFSNLLSNLSLTDMETCYKVFKKDIIQGIKIEENRFGFEPEITAKIAKLKCKIIEVPISYNPRKFEEGKKIGWKDGFKAISCIIKYNLFK